MIFYFYVSFPWFCMIFCYPDPVLGGQNDTDMTGSGYTSLPSRMPSWTWPVSRPSGWPTYNPELPNSWPRRLTTTKHQAWLQVKKKKFCISFICRLPGKLNNYWSLNILRGNKSELWLWNFFSGELKVTTYCKLSPSLTKFQYTLLYTRIIFCLISKSLVWNSCKKKFPKHCQPTLTIVTLSSLPALVILESVL